MHDKCQKFRFFIFTINKNKIKFFEGKKNDCITNEELISLFLNTANEAKNILMPSVLTTLKEVTTIPQIILLVCVKKLIKNKAHKLNFDVIMSNINDYHKVNCIF